MNRKEHQIWKEIKYDEYLIDRYIFSFEKQLRFQGKIVLDYVIFDSYVAQKTYEVLELDVKNKLIHKKQEVNYQYKSYNNENHPFWKNKNFYNDDYLETLYYECLLVEEDGLYIIPYDIKPYEEDNIKLWC